jgi:hypothetical protein
LLFPLSCEGFYDLFEGMCDCGGPRRSNQKIISVARCDPKSRRSNPTVVVPTGIKVRISIGGIGVKTVSIVSALGSTRLGWQRIEDWTETAVSELMPSMPAPGSFAGKFVEIGARLRRKL